MCWKALVVVGGPFPLLAQELSSLRARISGIAAEYHGTTGVAIEHIESGRRMDLNGHRRFPLASIYKVPMMIEAFRQAAEGRISLADRIEIRPESYHGWGDVMSKFDLGLQPTLRDLIFWMIVETDNLATDLVLAKVGVENVRRTLGEMGLDEISIDRPTRILILDYFGFTSDYYHGLSGAPLEAVGDSIGPIMTAQLADAARHRPLPARVLAYDRDPRDSGSPLAVNQLFIRIFEGKMVNPDASKQMLDILLQTRTGAVGWIAGAKLRGRLPAGTPVAHKTGDWPTSNGDAGIIYLPAGRGHLAVTVLNTDMNEDFPASARMVARIARAAYDYFAH